MTVFADELTYMRIQTKAFIDADVKNLTFSRLTKTANGSGGFTSTRAPLAFPQRMRLIPMQGNGSPLRQTLDGEAVTPDYVLLGEFDASLKRWDTFTDLGRRYMVLFVHEKSTYEKKGEVKYLGEV